jgi:hypothetical protein
MLKEWDARSRKRAARSTSTGRRHDDFVAAADLDLPLLHPLQHECATRDTAAALIKKRRPGFSSLTVSCHERPFGGRTLIRLSLIL